jgi:hypothetical protein
VIGLFVLCALLPVAVALLLAYDRVQTALLSQRIAMLRGTANGYGTSLIDRLGIAESLGGYVAAEMAAGRPLRSVAYEGYFRSALPLHPSTRRRRSATRRLFSRGGRARGSCGVALAVRRRHRCGWWCARATGRRLPWRSAELSLARRHRTLCRSRRQRRAAALLAPAVGRGHVHASPASGGKARVIDWEDGGAPPRQLQRGLPAQPVRADSWTVVAARRKSSRSRRSRR